MGLVLTDEKNEKHERQQVAREVANAAAFLHRCKQLAVAL
jgi:hypothetical protein